MEKVFGTTPTDKVVELEHPKFGVLRGQVVKETADRLWVVLLAPFHRFEVGDSLGFAKTEFAAETTEIV